jgi:4-oxalmesaconate hydratase
MIIDAHAHYTSAPPQLQAFRGTQITNYARPAKGRLNVSDEQIVDSVKGQVGRMDEWGIDRLMFSPQATAMGHQFGTPLISRHWTEHCNELIGRIAQLLPDRFSAVCQLPQSPGISPSEWVDELDRCVNDLGFVACNINPDMSGGAQPFTPSVGDEWWYPLWEKMVELDIPGTIHASATLNPAFHVTSSHYICQHHNAGVEILGSRVFQDFPNLKIIIPHGGGAIPYQWNRHRGTHVRGGLEPFEEAARRVYWDMAIYDTEAMEMLIKKVGVDNVLFATEMFGAVNATDPATGRSFEDVPSMFKDIEWLTDEDRLKITEGNARKVYSRLP